MPMTIQCVCARTGDKGGICHVQCGWGRGRYVILASPSKSENMKSAHIYTKRLKTRENSRQCDRRNVVGETNISPPPVTQHGKGNLGAATTKVFQHHLTETRSPHISELDATRAGVTRRAVVPGWPRGEEALSFIVLLRCKFFPTN